MMNREIWNVLKDLQNRVSELERKMEYRELDDKSFASDLNALLEYLNLKRKYLFRNIEIIPRDQESGREEL